ncbi:MAG TPA: DUF4350 domain-containing protein, partial [Acidimicrobiales bacterium]|nr:DUF4350 domain-containing protein [Acidimicrobiales bacterium]
SRHGRAVALGLLAVFAIAVFWVLVGSPKTAPTPYSPSSTAPNGAKALALLLSQLGDKVNTSGLLPAPGKGVALVLYDQLDGSTRAEVTKWVKRGGTLVVADPTSPLEGTVVAQGLPNRALTAAGSLAPACRAPWVRDVSLVDPEGDALLEVPSGAYSCFPVIGHGSASFAVAENEGAGVVVALGGADLWSNRYLSDTDNALLAADLLAPAKGATVGWLLTSRVGSGTATIWSLVPSRVKALLATLAIAVLAACVWRARRLGRPVLEVPIVPLPGSELVVATGRLLEKNGRFEEAAALLRADAFGQIASRLGQASGTGTATVAQVAAHYSGLPGDEVVAALCGPPPRNETDLLELARSLQLIREEVLSGAVSRS